MLAGSIADEREAATGVNHDEEAMNLMRYQQSYVAAFRLSKSLNSPFAGSATTGGVAVGSGVTKVNVTPLNVASPPAAIAASTYGDPVADPGKGEFSDMDSLIALAQGKNIEITTDGSTPPRITGMEKIDGQALLPM